MNCIFYFNRPNDPRLCFVSGEDMDMDEFKCHLEFVGVKAERVFFVVPKQNEENTETC